MLFNNPFKKRPIQKEQKADMGITQPWEQKEEMKIDSKQLLRKARLLLVSAKRELNILVDNKGDAQKILNLEGTIKLVEDGVDSLYAVGEKANEHLLLKKSFTQRVAALQDLIGNKNIEEVSSESLTTPSATIHSLTTSEQQNILTKIRSGELRGINQEQKDLINSLIALEEEITAAVQKMQMSTPDTAEKTRINFHIMELERRHREILEKVVLFLSNYSMSRETAANEGDLYSHVGKRG